MQPFALIRWESNTTPTEAMLNNAFTLDGLSPAKEEWPAGTHTPEMKFPQKMTRMLLSGTVQCAFPGYGVYDLKPGDTLEIEAQTLHDLKVTGAETVILLNAFH